MLLAGAAEGKLRPTDTARGRLIRRLVVAWWAAAAASAGIDRWSTSAGWGRQRGCRDVIASVAGCGVVCHVEVVLKLFALAMSLMEVVHQTCPTHVVTGVCNEAKHIIQSESCTTCPQV